MTDRHRRFAELHVPGDPLVLVNIWDAGSAAAVAKAGAKALATGSASVAGAQGYADGQDLPLDRALDTIARIAATTDLPVSLDFEGGYATDPETLARNAAAIVETGAVGINFEDQVIGGTGLHDTGTQSARIRAIRDGAGAPLWINARTDIFLQAPQDTHDPAMIDTALARAEAYARAGGDSFFAPGLRAPELIARLCARSPLPVNIMVAPGMATRAELAACGAARLSHGPFPWRAAMAALTQAATDAMA
ncbi:isocitrate lyase/phosphoenolpyruvate mutase family protein [Roseobacter sp. HKCCA0434]|uniref:isocitrate lyase/PEP mutase family protein n=1 Tax=Roseobacter sp. HKCCA0434 TaxID=3079297 RepID=UPI002905D80F|nr:isocitrate lyase/phosphoenolpyruvate mutase family protein [Roseobacter sp. HKCCA0434]